MTVAAFQGALLRILFCLLSGMLVQPAWATDWTLDQLMQSLAKNRQGRASFVEKKTVAVLDRPVESSGELLYIAPSRLEKKTIKPKAESLILDGDTLTIERGNKKHTLQLQDYPEVAGLIDSIRGTLAGDRKALERFFKLDLSGDAKQWTLVLLPHDERVAQTVQMIRITGRRDDVRAIDILHTNGDRSSMTIERIVAQ